MDDLLKPYETKMQKTIGALQNDLAGIRAGRANPAVLDRIMVDYYGSPTPIQQVAAISVSEARVLVISPYDKSAIGGIETAIRKSELGINPSNDGNVVRITFPQLTEERRRDLCKDVKKKAEDSKVAIRSIRREAIEDFKAQKKKSDITEDDLKILENDTQKLTDKFIKEVDKVAEAKEKEILEI